ncbi:unnamed protein product [Soboliphyme baturini]|uniref:Uncharacterized protein n=1 Tax=Soboliphyme baturini TaxID=241478 RepID=A0A3P8D2Z1_9BILA|nr:unnamed protein product [Soboliphyme baturini]
MSFQVRDPKGRHSIRSLPGSCTADSRSRSQRKLIQANGGTGVPSSQSCYAMKDGGKDDFLMPAVHAKLSYCDNSNVWSRNAAPYYVESKVQKKKGPRSLDITYKASKYERHNKHPAVSANVCEDSWSDVASDMYRLDRRPIALVQSKNKQYSNMPYRHSCRNAENIRLPEGNVFQQKEECFKDRSNNIGTIVEDAPLCTFSVSRSTISGDARFQPGNLNSPTSAFVGSSLGQAAHPPPPRPPKKLVRYFASIKMLGF